MDSPTAGPPSPSDSPAEAPRRRSGGQKRKASNPSSYSAPSKRLIKERNALNIHSSSPLHNGPVTRAARQTPSKLAASCPGPAAALGPVSCPKVDGGAAIGAEEEMAVALDEPVVDVEFDAVRSRGSGVHVVPVPAGWFSWKDIHQIEKHIFKSFFNGKSECRTPEIYMEIRNSIMKKYHADPQSQMELKDLSEISVGDMEARQEVMEFLAHWGLINFHPFPCSDPEVSNPDTEDKQLSSLVEKLYKFEMVQSCPWILPKKVEVSAPAEMPKYLSESAIAEDLVGPVGPSVEYHCNSCSADCSRKRYHCQKQADFDLCTECYNNGKFGSGMTSADFILMEPAEVPGVSSGSWTDQETLLLLEALELFSENWNEIAEHVATKTKAQCILHFLQMPIEDPFLDGNDDADDKVQELVDPSSDNNETNAPCLHETKEADKADAADQPNSLTTDVSTKIEASKLEFSCENGTSLPIHALRAAFQAIGLTPEQELSSFAEAGNPVMALAAYLTHLVEPDAAKTSFRSSLKAMSQESPGIQLATRHCFILENPPNDKKDPPASESAVTDMEITESPKEEGQMPTLNESKELEAPNGSVGSKPSNGSEEFKPPNDNNEFKPPNGSNKLKPSNDSDQTKPSSGRDELKPSSGIDELNSSLSFGGVDSKTVDGCGELKPSNGDDKSKPSNGSDESNDCPKNEEDAVAVENEMKLLVPSQDCSQKMMATMEPGDLDSTMQTASSSTKEPDATLKGEKIIPCDVKDVEDSASPTVLSLTNSKEPGDLTFQGEVAPNAADETKVSDVAREDKPDSVRELDKLASVYDIEAISGSTIIVDTKPTSAPSEDPESQQKVVTDLALDSKETTGVVL